MRETTRILLSGAIAGPLLLAGILSVGFPAQAGAQDCHKCGWSDEKPWPSLKCYEDDGGDAAKCKTIGGPTTTCKKSGGPCAPAMADGKSAQRAIDMVRKGHMLPPDGGYFFVSEDTTTLVVRKCDLSLVAKIPALGVARAGVRVALGGGKPATQDSR